MNEKEKAEAYVRSKLPELMCSACGGDGTLVVPDPQDETGQTPRQEQCNYCAATGWGNMPQLQDWLRELGNVHVSILLTCMVHKDDTFSILGVNFDLTTGQPATEEDYQKFNEIVGI